MIDIKKQQKQSAILYESIDFQQQTSIKILKIDIKENEKHRKIPKHWHRSMEIIIPFEGATNVWIEGKMWTVFPGDFLLINSKKVHACSSFNSNQPYYGYAIQIKYDFLYQCFGEIDTYEFCRQFEETDRCYLLQLLNNMIQFSDSSESFRMVKIYALVYEFMYQLLSFHCHQKVEGYRIDSIKNKDRLVAVLNYLDETLTEPFNAKEVAQHFHLSYGYLARLFKTHLQMSMKEYVSSQRVNKAKIDLIETDRSILDIALECGFANSKAFYREFKKYHKETPKAYRLEHKK